VRSTLRRAACGVRRREHGAACDPQGCGNTNRVRNTRRGNRKPQASGVCLFPHQLVRYCFAMAVSSSPHAACRAPDLLRRTSSRSRQPMLEVAQIAEIRVVVIPLLQPLLERRRILGKASRRGLSAQTLIQAGQWIHGCPPLIRITGWRERIETA
jgi:hypothetical protein